MNHYARTIEIISSLGRELTTVEKYVAVNHPGIFVKAHQDKAVYNAVLLDYPHDKKLPCIKEIRMLTGLGLKESKEASESLPYLLRSEVPIIEAMDVKKQFESIGATVAIEQA